MNKIICLLCNREFVIIHQNHLKNVHKITLKQYRQLFPGMPTETEEYRQMRINALDGAFPGWTLEQRKEMSIKRKGIPKSEKWKEVRKRNLRENGNPNTGKKFSQQRIENIRNALKEGYSSGRIKGWNEGQTRATNSSLASVGDKNKQRMKDPVFREFWLNKQLKSREGSYTRSTDIELMLQKELDNRFIKYEVHRPFYKFHTVPDIFIEPNIVVYADGDYWHDSKEAKESDMKQTYSLKTHGYEVVRLKGSEIHKDVGACVDFIELHMNQQSNIEQEVI